ncbi:MAG TPA: AMP-binding protein [Steroidobacteraceae bacterium]|nr:AMP-binding protein [Steroidobacteraceae bacterium]
MTSLAYVTPAPQSIAAWRAGAAVTRAQFARHVELTADALPATRWIVNRCANRYHFAVAFLAACRRGATNLLPPGAGAQATAELLGGFDGAWLLEDAVVERAIVEAKARAAAPQLIDAPQIEGDHLAALVFTSGSTGKPRAHEKPWRALAMSARYCRLRLGARAVNVVVTVPPQHMYGLETSIFTLLAGDWALHDSHAFYPDEIVAALRAIPAPRLLITAPFHLRHLLASRVELPPVDLVLSATAPLSAELAAEAERRLGAQLFEIYGCTEAGSMATRRTAHEEIWTPYPDLSFSVSDGATSVRAAHLAGEVAVGDRVELAPDGRFTLLGRDADMIKIGGRRGSLADIAARIAALPGVTDQAVFIPGEGETARPAALIVAPGRRAEDLRRELSARLDAVFVPRPMRIVAALPRNELGKLPRERLLDLLIQSENKGLGDGE